MKHELLKHNYGLLHIATHAEFGANKNDSYLLASDGKLTMSHLEKIISMKFFSEEPVELLTLSACNTGIGNRKSELGFAGAAIKNGVRSVIASLWQTDDAASMYLMKKFYRLLKEKPSYSKSQALQKAQKKLLLNSEYRHPAFWSTYILIGNWL